MVYNTASAAALLSVDAKGAELEAATVCAQLLVDQVCVCVCVGGEKESVRERTKARLKE